MKKYVNEQLPLGQRVSESGLRRFAPRPRRHSAGVTAARTITSARETWLGDGAATGDGRCSSQDRWRNDA